jgi:uncharacterized SAM-binding protein YcdF (DUF218 family)
MGRAYRLFRSTLAVFGTFCLIVMLTPLTRWYATKLAGPWQKPHGEVLIVLGAETPTEDFIGLTTYWRCLYAVRVWRGGNFNTILVSGGMGIAESMKEFLLFKGIPADRIVLENRSTSTRENALNAVAILANHPGRKVLLTSDMHTYRSVRAFRRAGITVTPHYFPYVAKYYGNWPQRWTLGVELAVETAKILVYRLRGWI